MRNAFEAEGEVRGTDLLVALVALWRQGASGSLQFSRSGATAGFDLSGGEIVGVSASDARFETAAILVRAGKLDDATLQRLSTPQGGDRALTALQAGVLTKREWRWGEKIRAVEVLSDLLSWLEGDYTFFRAPIRDGGEFRLTVPRLVLELFLRSRDRNLVLHYIGGVDVPLSRTRSFDAEFATFGLTADAESVVRLIDGRSTAVEISAEAPAEAFAVEKLLAALVTLGLVHAEFASAEEKAVPAVARPDPEAAPPQDEDEREERELEPDLGEEPESDLEEEKIEPAPGEPSAALAVSLPDRGPERLTEPGPDLDLSAGRDEVEDVSIEMPARAEPEDFRSAGDDADFEAERALPGDFATGDLGDRGGGAAFDTPLDMTTGIGGEDRPRHRSGSPLLWLLAVLAAGVGIVLVLRGRGADTVRAPVAALATPSPTAFAAEPTASFPAEAVGTPAPSPPPAVMSAVPATRAATAPTTPTARRPSVAPTAAPAARAASAERDQKSRQYWIDRAARDRKRASSDHRARFTIQLELACEVESVIDAWRHDRPAGTMWVLTSPFGGRTCFRVLWGRYASREAAQRALSSAPPFFSTPRNRPIVVPIR